MTRISERAIRVMSYESRIQHYNREKDELFQKLRGLPAKEFEKAHEKLRKKWDV